jgi:hypothetical protein
MVEVLTKQETIDQIVKVAKKLDKLELQILLTRKTMRVDRFVFDNNIWVSYLISGNEQKLIDIIADNDLTVFT